jgi:acyl carrier protein
LVGDIVAIQRVAYITARSGAQVTMVLDTRAMEKLQRVFREVFDREDGQDVSTLQQADEPSWDSLMHVSLIAAIESEFDVAIDAADSLAITSFKSAVTVLERQGR